MSKFFQTEIAAYGGEKNTFQNVKFRKRSLDNSPAAEAGTVLEIIPVHIKNPPVIQFIAYMENIADNFAASTSETQPFGRPDPYYVWKSNKRTIKVNLNIPSSGVTSALDNLNNLSWLLGSLYPTYKDNLTTTSIAASPLFRVRYGNLICSSTRDGQGLLGAIDGINVTHDFKAGVISISPRNMNSAAANTAGKLLKQAGFDSSIREGKKLMVPKEMKISFTLKVVHDHSLGWDKDTGAWRGGLSAPRFPYDFGMFRDTGDTPPQAPAVTSEGTSPSQQVAQQEEEAQAEMLFEDKGTDTGKKGIETTPGGS
tara:strand:- start:324 stop:1259 length:936 start_codon:yes stop_codon:yes gene_type:complete